MVKNMIKYRVQILKLHANQWKSPKMIHFWLMAKLKLNNRRCKWYNQNKQID